MEDLFIVLAVIVLVLVVIYYLVVFLIKILPMALTVIGALSAIALGTMLVIGLVKGAYGGIVGYYETLHDVYGKGKGLAIGLAVTAFWIALGALAVAIVM